MTVFRFKNFEFDSVPGSLLCQGQAVKLRPQTARALHFMLQHAETLVTREALVSYVWGDQVVNDQAIFQCINQLRKALGESASEPIFLKTVPRRGYKWIHPLEIVSIETKSDAARSQGDLENGRDSVASESHDIEVVSQIPKPKRHWVLVPILVCAVLMGILLYPKQGSSKLADASQGSEVVSTRTRLAFLPFYNGTEDAAYQWVELGLMDMVVRAFGNQTEIGVVPTSRVLEALRDFGMARGTKLEAGQSQRILQSLGTDWVVRVEITRQDRDFSLTYVALDKDGGDHRRVFTGSELSQLANRMADELRSLFQLKGTHPNQVFSEDAFVNEAYGLGIAEMDKGFDTKAISYFEVCIKKDPQFLWAGYQLAMAYDSVGRLKDARNIAHDYLKRAEAEGKKDLLADFQHLLGDWAFMQGDHAGSRSYYENAIELYRNLADYENLAMTYMSLGELYKDMGLVEQSWASFEKALDVLRSISNRMATAPVYGVLGLAYLDEGRTREAMRYLKEEMAIYKNLESWTDAALARFQLGSWYYFNDKPIEARNVLQEALAFAKRSEHKPTLMLAHEMLGSLDLEARDWAGAQNHLEEAFRWSEMLENPQETLNIQISMLKLAAYSNDKALLDRFSNSALALAESLDDLEAKRTIWSFLGEYHLNQRNLELGKSYLDKVWDSNPEKGAISLLLKARYLFETDEYSDAFRLQLSVKNRWPEVWDPHEEALLNRYREACGGCEE